MALPNPLSDNPIRWDGWKLYTSPNPYERLCLDSAENPTAAQIESEIEATRNRLASRLDDFQDYVKPANVVDRGVASAKGVFVDEYGGVRPERVAIAAGAVVALIALRALSRRRRG